MSKWPVLAVLGAAQLLMVLGQAVMNVAISQLVADFHTTVTTIQAVIALYALVMAGLMLIGGKLAPAARSGRSPTASSAASPGRDRGRPDPRPTRRFDEVGTGADPPPA